VILEKRFGSFVLAKNLPVQKPCFSDFVLFEKGFLQNIFGRFNKIRIIYKIIGYRI
jgi:hypothetical protein